MSGQFRYLLTYEQMVAAMLRSLPREEAMERAVGGAYESLGVLEHALLLGLGLRPDHAVIDVGCGSGRLAVQLARYAPLRYLGVDVVPALLDYARAKTARPDFSFRHIDHIALPAADGSADFVVFFSVFTHLLHEESYVYLSEAKRVLKPDGLAVFSFLEFSDPGAWKVFEAGQAWVRDRSLAGHLNVFLNRADLTVWAESLGLDVAAIRGAAEPCIVVDQWLATQAVPAGSHALGQSVCVLRKPKAIRSRPAEALPRTTRPRVRSAR